MSNNPSAGAPLTFSITDSSMLHDGFFKVKRFVFQYDRFQGSPLTGVSREVFLRGTAVGVLLVDPAKRQIILVEQFRAGAAAAGAENPWLIELVAGIVEQGEAPEEVAVRESEEEAGCIPVKLIPMHHYWVSPGGSDEDFYLFCGLVDSGTVDDFGGLEHENEDIKVHKLSFEAAFNWLKQGKLNNAMAIIGVQWLMLNQSQLQPN